MGIALKRKFKAWTKTLKKSHLKQAEEVRAEEK